MSQLGGAGGAGGAGGSYLGTMADAFANSIMVDSLIRGREGTIVPPDHKCYAPDLPEVGEAEAMERWEPWVRAYTALGELLRGIEFRATADGYEAFYLLSIPESAPAPASTSAPPPTPAPASAPKIAKGSIATIGRPEEATFQEQIQLVLNWAELRNERATEILAQIDPQYAFWSSLVYLHPTRTPRTFELINILLQFCVYVEMRFKHVLACWRPVEYNPQVQPVLTTPGHGAFPSGHATQAHAVAYVLGSLLKLDTTNHPFLIDQLKLQAARIATNRVIAGVHFPVDSMAGRMLGVALGEYFCARCDKDAVSTARTFHSNYVDAHAKMEFNPFADEQKLDVPASTATPPVLQLYSSSPNTDTLESPLMKHVWDKARAEWKGRFGVPAN
jgi:hypothetical protein